MPRAGMIRMRMRDHSAIYGPPRIDIKITRWAIQALMSLHNQILHD
jgi:hypothetical protein